MPLFVRITALVAFTEEDVATEVADGEVDLDGEAEGDAVESVGASVAACVASSLTGDCGVAGLLFMATRNIPKRSVIPTTAIRNSFLFTSHMIERI